MTENRKNKRILRSTNERMLAGVAGGLADYLDVDPTLVRLGFVAAFFFGGFGLLAYLVMAVVVPEDDGTGEPVGGRRPPIWALVLLGIAVLIVLPGPFGGWDGGWFWGIGLLWTGALLLAAAGAYRALRGRWPGQRADTAGDGATATKPAGSKASKSAGSEATTEIAPAGGGDGSPPRWVRFLAIAAIALFAFCGAASLAVLGGWATATGSGSIVAGTVIAIGAALVATAFFGETARRSAPWLLGLALVLAIPAGAVAAAEIEFEGGVGSRTYEPGEAADIPEDGYEFGVGQLVVDLRGLDWSPDQAVRLPVELGIGQLLVFVPSNVCVYGHADGKVGEVLVRGNVSEGVEPEFDRSPPPATQPRLELDAGIQIGQLRVTDRDPDDFTGDEHAPGARDRDELAPEPEACK